MIPLSGSGVQQPSELSRLLAEELTLVRQFVALLSREQAFLVANQTDELPTLAEQKARLAERLATLAAARDTALSANGAPGGKAGMDAWSKTRQAPASAAADWNALLSLAAEARALNTLNGELIVERMQKNRQALQILTAATERAALYGPDGQTKISTGGRILGSA